MRYNLFIGGYGTESLHAFTLTDGVLRHRNAFPAVNASWLCSSADGKHLYAVGETQRFRGELCGSVQSYDVGPGGRLTETSMAPSGGTDPCHLTIVGDLLLVSNYSSGSLARFRLNADGTIGEMLPIVAHEGRGLRPDRQQAPHVHQATFTPGGYLAVTDLGLDAVDFYPAHQLAADRPQAIRVSAPAGFGPRHCAFPRAREIWYALCELESQLLIYRGAPENAALIGRVGIGDGIGENAPAALRLSPNEKLLLATGRGQNVLSLFSLGDRGMPARLTEVSSRGEWPRDAQFSPDGRFIVCANQRSNSATVFAVCEDRLEYLGAARVPSPACVLFTDMEEE